jgi:hypothetical protein
LFFEWKMAILVFAEESAVTVIVTITLSSAF